MTERANQKAGSSAPQDLNGALGQFGVSLLQDLLAPDPRRTSLPSLSVLTGRAETGNPASGPVDERSRKALEAAKVAVDAAAASLWEADLLVQDIGTIASSSLNVLEEAQTTARNAHGSERREMYLEDAGEHLRRLHTRTEEIDQLGNRLVGRLDRAVTSVEAAERALEKVETLPDVPDVQREFTELRAQVGRMGELVTLARPMASQISQHADAATSAAYATTDLALLDHRVRRTGNSVLRIDQGATTLQTVMIHADSAARNSHGLADSINYATRTNNPEGLPTQAGSSSAPTP